MLCIQQTIRDEGINGEGISEEEERRMKLQTEVLFISKTCFLTLNQLIFIGYLSLNNCNKEEMAVEPVLRSTL